MKNVAGNKFENFAEYKSKKNSQYFLEKAEKFVTAESL